MIRWIPTWAPDGMGGGCGDPMHQGRHKRGVAEHKAVSVNSSASHRSDELRTVTDDGGSRSRS